MSSKRGRKMADPSYGDVYQCVQQHSCPFVTTTDVSEQFPSVTDRTIRNRLDELVERDRLERRRVGPHAKVWYLPD